MSARILDGEAFASQIHRETASRVSALLKRGITPRLVFIRVGEDPASRAYVSRKETRAKEVGISSHTLVLPESTPLPSLLAEIDALNADPKVHGILIQSPPSSGTTQRSGLRPCLSRQRCRRFSPSELRKASSGRSHWVSSLHPSRNSRNSPPRKNSNPRKTRRGRRSRPDRGPTSRRSPRA